MPSVSARFAYSWGPLAWLIPSEVLSLETRSAGYSITTFINFLMTFVIGQAFLSMMCTMKVRTLCTYWMYLPGHFTVRNSSFR